MGKNKKAGAVVKPSKPTPKVNGKAAPLKSKPVETSSDDSSSEEEPTVKSSKSERSIANWRNSKWVLSFNRFQIGPAFAV